MIKIRFGQAFEAIQHNATLTCRMKMKTLFSGIIKNVSGLNKSNRGSRQSYPLRVCWLLFLNLTLCYTAFTNSAYPENWALLYEALSMLAIRKNRCSHINFTSLSTLNKKFLSTFNFAVKINEFLSKIPPISHTFVEHKRCWRFNITQSLCVMWKCIFKVF